VNAEGTVGDGAFGLRPAAPEDAAEIARLSCQLGYPSDAAQMAPRLRALSDPESHGLFVASDEAGRVIGWLHVSVERTVESDAFAEIRGLVVDEARRGRGIGAGLVRSAVAWARQRGLTRIRVRSNVTRERTREFYLRLGFSVRKTQAVFDLDIPV